MLKEQYRMRAEIREMASSCFYDGQLRDGAWTQPGPGLDGATRYSEPELAGSAFLSVAAGGGPLPAAMPTAWDGEIDCKPVSE